MSGVAGTQLPLHIQVLAEELRKRKERNPRYSLRAFSMTLGIDPSALSRILNGKQELSLASRLNVANKLNLRPEERAQFLSSVAKSRTLELQRQLDLGSGGIGANPSSLSEAEKRALDWIPQILVVLPGDFTNILYGNRAWRERTSEAGDTAWMERLHPDDCSQWNLDPAMKREYSSGQVMDCRLILTPGVYSKCRFKLAQMKDDDHGGKWVALCLSDGSTNG